MKNILDEDIKSGNIRTVYLLYGEEDYLKEVYKKRLRAAIAGDDTMNVNTFAGRDIDVKEIINLSETMPFFAEKRLILVEDSGFFKKGQEDLASYIPKIPETTCIVFVERETDKRSRIYKAVRECGQAVEMARQESRELAMWAARYLRDNGKSITEKTMDELLLRTGPDMTNIRSELDKLICYVKDADAVTSEDVREIVTARTESRVFDMVDAIVSGKTETAMGLYRDLLAMREPPMRILFLIARQFSQLLAVKEMLQAGKDRGSIASALKVPPFAVRKLAAQAKNYSGEEITARVTRAVELEEAVKTGKMGDRIAVELLIAGK
ncbi:MAG: DNA polymerase III subunit delta [Clostridium sp.]|nr:DNA polymerase III subunit delta [Clostridium sp.]